MDGGAWWAAVYGVTHSRTQLKRLSSSSSNLCRGRVGIYAAGDMVCLVHVSAQSTQEVIDNCGANE